MPSFDQNHVLSCSVPSPLKISQTLLNGVICWCQISHNKHYVINSIVLDPCRSSRATVRHSACCLRSSLAPSLSSREFGGGGLPKPRQGPDLDIETLSSSSSKRNFFFVFLRLETHSEKAELREGQARIGPLNLNF